jgi:arsenite-transporting ATPase
MRLILYVGKGGVGKTTLAAATAVRAAELGKRTLVVSTDIAHSLGDVLGIDLGSEPREIIPSLYAEEINVLDEMHRTWGKVQRQISEFFREKGATEVQADELAILPGMEEIAALITLGRRVRSGEYDCIVVDAAPTGETIRLLSLPESYQWYAERVMGLGQRLQNLAGPFLRGALPDLSVLDVVGQVADRVTNLHGILTDPNSSSYRIVVTPDRVVLKEARRAETYLNIFDYPVDAVIVNRLLTKAGTGHPFMDTLAARQDEILAEIQRAYATLPTFQAPWWPEEPVGSKALAEFARQLFGDRDPTEVMHVGPTQRIERRENGYLLSIRMPNVEATRLSVRKRGDSLFIDVANCRREITLPRALVPLEPAKARLKGGILEIPFVTQNGSQAASREE